MDTVTSSTTIKFEYLFTDGDTRTQAITNPKSGITPQQVTEFETLILNGGTSTLLLGDKTKAPFRRINSAILVNTTRVNLDIS